MDRVRSAGGLCWKWTSPSTVGVPDRICVLPGGRVAFVEVKRPGGKLSAMQQRIIGLMRRLGAEVHVLESKEAVDEVFG